MTWLSSVSNEVNGRRERTPSAFPCQDVDEVTEKTLSELGRELRGSSAISLVIQPSRKVDLGSERLKFESRARFESESQLLHLEGPTSAVHPSRPLIAYPELWGLLYRTAARTGFAEGFGDRRTALVPRRCISCSVVFCTSMYIPRFELPSKFSQTQQEKACPSAEILRRVLRRRCSFSGVGRMTSNRRRTHFTNFTSQSTLSNHHPPSRPAGNSLDRLLILREAHELD